MTLAYNHTVNCDPSECPICQDVQRRGTVERSEVWILASVERLLQELLAETRELRAAIGQSSDSRSSVELKSSTRGVDATCKAYAGSPIIEAESEAVRSYFRVLNEVQDRLNGNGSAS